MGVQPILGVDLVGAQVARISSSRISAAVPGSVLSPAAMSRFK